jgi:hypothetical protein
MKIIITFQIFSFFIVNILAEKKLAVLKCLNGGTVIIIDGSEYCM